MVTDCNALSVGSGGRCRKHGGGKRCNWPAGCNTPAIGGYLTCIKHGGGKRCRVSDCGNSARAGIDTCAKHRPKGAGMSASGAQKRLRQMEKQTLAVEPPEI